MLAAGEEMGHVIDARLVKTSRGYWNSHVYRSEPVCVDTVLEVVVPFRVYDVYPERS